MEALMKQQSLLPLHKRSKGLNKHQASQVFLQHQRNWYTCRPAGKSAHLYIRQAFFMLETAPPSEFIPRL